MAEPTFIREYFYLWIVALVAPCWMLIFLLKKQSRREVVYMGLLFGAAALSMDRYSSFYDYWRPALVIKSFNFESFFYGFFFGGVATRIHEFVTRREFHFPRPPSPWIILILAPVTGAFYMAFLLLGGFVSVFIYIFIMAAYTAVILAAKPRLTAVSLVSGLLMTVLNMCWYGLILTIDPGAIEDIWITSNLSGAFLFGLPVEEHLFIFFLGAFGSVFYKALARNASKDCKENVDSPGVISSRLRSYWPAILLLIVAILRILVFGESGRFVIRPMWN